MSNVIDQFRNLPKKQRLSWQFGCLTAIGLFLILLVVLQSIKIVNYADYTNPQYGLHMKYPAFWTRIDNPPGGAIVAFVSPKENEMDVFTENVNISFQDLSKTPMNLQQFSQVAIQQLTMTFGNQIKVLEKDSTRLSGLPAYKFKYVGTEKENTLELMHVWAVEGNRAFIITYTASEKDFQKNAGFAEAMIRSFTLH